MAFDIVLQKESGVVIASIGDDRNLLHRILIPGEATILGGIDWYGDTVFNRQQMKQFIPAWHDLLARALSEEDKILLSSIEALAQKCASGIHLYLKFIGD